MLVPTCQNIVLHRKSQKFMLQGVFARKQKSG